MEERASHVLSETMNYEQKQDKKVGERVDLMDAQGFPVEGSKENDPDSSDSEDEPLLPDLQFIL